MVQVAARWKETAIIVSVAFAMLDAAAPSFAAQQPSPSQAADSSGRQHHRHRHGVRDVPPYEPHYYARPYYYRPYPYGVPYPFVLGYGPWW